MGGMALTLYLVTTFAGGLTSGLAGFALGLVVCACGCTSCHRRRSRS